MLYNFVAERFYTKKLCSRLTTGKTALHSMKRGGNEMNNNENEADNHHHHHHHHRHHHHQAICSAPSTYKKLSYRKETVQLLHNIKIWVLH